MIMNIYYLLMIIPLTHAIPLTHTLLLNWMQAAPCAVLALLIHPSTAHNLLNRILWAFCVYLEAVSVLPQLRVMQNTKVWCFDFIM
jgi:hypothetical protein